MRRISEMAKLQNPGGRSEFEGPEPADESEHFRVCEFCGQAYDMRDLGQLLYHQQQPSHEPLDLDG